MPLLYRKHAPALAAAYADIENHALHQDEIVAGTPGSMAVRSNAQGTRYYVRQYYDFEGRKRDQYVGLEGQGEELLRAWNRRIAEAKDVQATVRLLAREGYSLLQPKHLAALVPLARRGIFAAGAMLVGTHAFEVLVNRLGVRAAGFATEDVDIARPGKLALAERPKGGLIGLLRESGIDFVPVPPLRHAAPSTSFKEKGRSRFTFDLLVPVPGEDIQPVAVPELDAHATGLPYLRYLVSASQTGAALSTHGVVAVRVPLAERFALHKLLVAALRAGRPEKSRKDLRQAAVLLAALGELQPGAIEEAFARTPASGRRHIRRSLAQLGPVLEGHPQAWDEARRVVKPLD